MISHPKITKYSLGGSDKDKDRLHLNEWQFDHPWLDCKFVMSSLFTNYPSSGSPNETKLIALLSNYYKVPSQCIKLCAGADDGIDLICKVYVRDKTNVFIYGPTY